MKIRTDFVSNSSSSSFICLLSDNKAGILLINFKSLSLREYLKEFGWREVFEYSYWFDADKKPEVKFVSNQTFSSKFGEGSIDHCLPEAARLPYDEFCNANKRLDELWAAGVNIYNGKDSEAVKICETMDVLRSKIVDAMFTALDPDWGKETFCYEEVSDNISFDETVADDLDCWSMEELTTEKFDYLNSLKKLKFCRTFSNH